MGSAMHPLVIHWLPAGGLLLCWAGYCWVGGVGGVIDGGAFVVIGALLFDSCLPRGNG